MKSLTLFPNSFRLVKILNQEFKLCHAQNSIKHRQNRNLSNATQTAKTTKNKKVFRTLIDDTVRDEHFDKNVKKYERYLTNYEQLLKVASSGGGPKAIERHTVKQKKMLATERLKHFLDDDSDFLEMSVLAGMQMEYGDIPRAGIITG